MTKPTLQLLSELKENNYSKKDLLDFGGYKTIYEAKSILGLNKASDVYHYLLKDYNEAIKAINKSNIQKYQKQMARWLDKETERNSAEDKAKRLEKKLAKQQKQQKGYSNEIKQLVYQVPENNLSSIRESLMKFIGKNIIIHYVDDDGDTVFKLNFNIPSTFSSWWKKQSWEFIGSNYDLIGTGELSGKIFIYEENPIITTEKLIQSFQEGVTNCLLTPIKDWAIELLENSKRKQSKCRYNGIIKNIEEYEIICKDGVKEDLIPEICNKLQIDISIQMPYCETKFIECKSIKKRLKHFNFLNTRLNHIDLNEITNLSNYINSTKDEIKSIKSQLDNEGAFYYYNRELTTLYTVDKIYKTTSLFGEVINEFEIDNNINEYGIDDITQPELSKFISQGTHYNSTVDFNENIQSAKFHNDMEKAYAKFYTCKFYEEFLGKITDFRCCNKIEGVGLYKICNLDFTKAHKQFVEYNSKMGIYKNNLVYPSPELKMLSYYGVKYTIVAGCWGVESFDFRFSEDMLLLKDDEVSYYAKWCGLIDSHKLTKDMWFKGDYQMAQMIINNYGEGIVKWYENNEICVSYPKKHNSHKGHITAFITSYQRMSVIEQLMEIDIKNVIRVCVDGIYFTQPDVICKNVFRPKTEFKFGNVAGDCYISNDEELSINDFNNFREHNHKELHIGAGGNGKTHKNLMDKGLVKILYCSPSWKLARNKQAEYNCSVKVWANILTTDPSQIGKVKQYYNVLLIDEASMMTELQKQMIFDTYSNMKIIFCGDLGFQLSCVTGIEMDKTGFDAIIQNDTNYRCKDKRLLNILSVLRSMIEYELPKSDINLYVINEFRKFGKYIKVKDIDYKIDDMILTGTNTLKDYFTGLLDTFGSVNKYYITSNNRVYSNGEIVIGVKPEVKCEIRHAFTTHSIQGETALHNLFIDSSKMFDSRMFYTALSRAKTLDQIYIIEPNEEMIQLCVKV